MVNLVVNFKLDQVQKRPDLSVDLCGCGVPEKGRFHRLSSSYLCGHLAVLNQGRCRQSPLHPHQQLKLNFTLVSCLSEASPGCGWDISQPVVGVIYDTDAILFGRTAWHSVAHNPH